MFGLTEAGSAIGPGRERRLGSSEIASATPVRVVEMAAVRGTCRGRQEASAHQQHRRRAQVTSPCA